MQGLAPRVASFCGGCILVALTGCYGGPSAGQTPATEPAAPARPTGKLVVAVDNLGTELWLRRTIAGDEAPVLSAIGDTLLTVDPQSETLENEMLESWKVEPASDGGTKWTLRLKSGIPFHDNQGTVTAADVKFTFAQFFVEGSIGASGDQYKAWIGKLENAQPIDDLTMVVNSPKVNAGLEWRFTSRHSNVPIIPKKYFESVGEEGYAKRPLSTGSFQFVEHQTNRSVTLRAVENHWRKTPEFEELTFLIVPEASTRLALLRSGSVDIATLPMKLKPEAQAAGVRIVRTERAGETFVILGGRFLPNRPKFDPSVPWVNPDPAKGRLVREAMNIAIDRKAIVDRILLGEGTPLSIGMSFQGPGTPWWKPEWKLYEYNPAKAKQLLAEAGYPGGFALTMWVIPLAYGPHNVDVAEAVASYWEAIGIKVTRAVVEYRPTVTTRIVEKDTAGAAYAYTNPFVTEPVNYMCSSWYSKSVITHIEIPFHDEACDRATSEPSFEKRVQIYTEVGDYHYKEFTFVPIALVNALWAVGPRVGPWTPHPGRSTVTRLEYASHAR